MGREQWGLSVPSSGARGRSWLRPLRCCCGAERAPFRQQQQAPAQARQAKQEQQSENDEQAGKVVRGGPNALAASKQLVARVPQMGRDEAFDWTAPLSQRLFGSDEAREGIGAFRERRDAAWVPEVHRSGTGRA